MNRAGLAAAVAESTGLTGAKAGEAVEAMLDSIASALRHGRDVRLTGFGSFAVTRRKASVGRNPRTGAAIDIPPSISVKFRPGRTLKEAVGPGEQWVGRLAQR
ncbi:MAG: HU family DNA-binding protein [Acetobacteraceae bacterium]|nr:HU family DNA-binding protein [Acetobacteraceae bacterium]